MEIIMRRAVQEDVDVIAGILQKTMDGINDPDAFVGDDKAYIGRHIEAEGFVLVAYCDNAAAGFMLVDFPGEQDYHLGNDLGWDGSRRTHAAHLDIACVLPAYRGLGLQKRLMVEGETLLQSMGYIYALATVYPKNTPSLKNLIAAGYEIGTTKLKYSGVVRHIVWKKLRSDDGKSAGDTVSAT